MAPAADVEDEIKDEKNPRPLDEDDIALLKTYVLFFLYRKPNLIFLLVILFKSFVSCAFFSNYCLSLVTDCCTILR